MSSTPAIPDSEHRNVLKLWTQGSSTREISDTLKAKGIDASHVAVWRLIQRIGEGGGSLEVAAVMRVRNAAGDDVEKLMDIERQIINSARPAADDRTLDSIYKRARVLAIGHRLHCNRLRAAGVYGALGDSIHRDFAHIWAGAIDEDELPRDEKVPAPAAAPEPPHEVLRVTEQIQPDSSENRRNSPADVTPAPAVPAAAPAAPPSRTRACPCGSGLKYKKCCADDAPHPERRKKAA